MILVAAFVAAFALSAALVPVTTRLARAFGLYAHPSHDRWHQRPVPKIGGAAMLAALITVIAGAGAARALAPVIVATSAMFAVGFVDDLRALGPGTKFVFQMLVAGLLLFLLPDGHITGAAIVDLALGFAWIVGLTNAVNLIDNIDGLAAGVAGLAALALLAVQVAEHGLTGAGPAAVGLSALAGVTAGFLVHNFHRASIFMGDGGSHLLGAFLAGVTLLTLPAGGSAPAAVTLAPVAALLVPIFDTVFVTATRGLAGRSAFLGGRDHTSHRLVALGLGEHGAVLTLYALTIVGGGVAVGLVTLPGRFAWSLFAFYAVVLVATGLYLARVAVQTGTAAPIPAPAAAVAAPRAPEILLDAFLVGAAYYLAFAARFHDHRFWYFLPYFARSLPLVAGLQLATFWWLGKYRRRNPLGWPEILRLTRDSAFGVAASVIAVLYIESFQGYSRGVFVIDAVLAPLFIVAARAVVDSIDQYLRQRDDGRAALIYGAGQGGALAARELLHNPALGLTPIGFIDDDEQKRWTTVEGLPVMGTLDDLDAILDRRPNRVSTVIVGIDQVGRERMERLRTIAAERRIAVRRMRLDVEDLPTDTPRPGIVRFPGV